MREKINREVSFFRNSRFYPNVEYFELLAHVFV
jgi:hypothetical protein